jgi:ABC-type sugar transport system permease subunit
MRARPTLREPAVAVLFIVPAFIGLAIFFYYPIGQTIIFSFFDLDHTSDWLNAPFVGLQNYIDVMRSEQFWLSLRFTFLFTVASVFIQFWIGLGMAMATFAVVPKLRGVLRAIIIVPWAIPQIIQAAMWKWLYNTDVGLIGDLLVKTGLVSKPPLFLADPQLAMAAVIFAYVWKTASVTSIFLMGGLAMVPDHLIDAAKVDGARAWMRFWRVTVPLIMPTILVTLLFRTRDALRAFDIIYGLTGGGPGTRTDVLSSFAYKFYFTFVEYGLGSAYALITFILIMALSLFYLKRIRPHLQFRR